MLFWALGLGVFILLVAGWPFWLTGVPVSLGYPANRATLSFMLGVSLLFAGLLALSAPSIELDALGSVRFAGSRATVSMVE